MKTLFLLFISIFLGFSSLTTWATDTAAVGKSKVPSIAAQSVQARVNKEMQEKGSEKRKVLLVDATDAISQTKNALKLLEDKKTDEALKALSSVTGRLELILARDPSLALAPVDTQIETHDLNNDADTIKGAISLAQKSLNAGDVQKARLLIAGLGSEIDYTTVNIPLATYPAAIKAITPLIDAGKIDEAKAALTAALNTLVITTQVVPLPELRAGLLLKDAQALSEKKDRTAKDDEALSGDLKEARNQLKIAELLGYAEKKAFAPIYSQIDQIEKKTSGGKSGLGWFDKIKQQVQDLFKAKQTA